ncbi:MAG: exodeoxyribonuclease VII large subunit [Bacteroidales bacterium]|nr:exodeoxyribonuclease VII large subunit [Bacteroidales bacterium]
MEIVNQTTEHTTKRKYYTLVDIANSLKSIISKNYTGKYWVKAEMAKLNHYPKSGHCYPDLVEKKDSIIKAQMRAIIWSGDYNKISKKFKEVTKESLRDGMTVLFLAKINFHQIYGISLNILDIEPSFTLGEMARQKREIIERLKREGIFENNKKLPFPLLPKRLAIISVETSKGYSDFINIIKRNSWNYKFFTFLFPALLQGDKAAESIKLQLKIINKCIKHFDVVLIIRGGGGDIGLNCYDNYTLAKEVALFPIPVITGIGHSTNETVVEMVSCQNKITPTDVAYFLIQKFHNFSVYIEELQNKIVDYAEKKISDENKRLNENIKLF